MAEQSLNRVTLLGRLGQDPEVKQTQIGTTYCTFSIATTQVWKDEAGTEQKKTDWHRVVAWNKLAEIVQQYLKQGSRIYMEGSLHTRQYDDKDGQKKFITEIKLNYLLMLSHKDGSSIDSALKEHFDAAPIEDDGLPF